GQARDAGVNVRSTVIERGAEFLRVSLIKAEQEEDLAAFMLYALTGVQKAYSTDPLVTAAFDRLWARRDQLNPYTRALFALASHAAGKTDWTATLARNMRNGLVEDKPNGTAHWGEAGVNWRWSEGGIEATAFSLRALLAIDP